MRALIVLAHPLPESFAHEATRRIEAALTRRGLAVDLLDLYAEGFDPVLSAAERRAYLDTSPDPEPPFAERVRAAQKLALVFPQWWFGFPAILKGFFDRTLVSGVAYEREPDGRFTPLLTQLDAFWAVTSTGSPWWYARLIAGDPTRRLLARGVKPQLCPRARFRLIQVNGMDAMTREKGAAQLRRIEREFTRF